MEVSFKYLDRTWLEEAALLKLIKKYTNGLKYDIKIIFDIRLNLFGNFHFDSKKRNHIIRISPLRCGISDDGKKFDEAAEKYNLISTLLHEIKHAIQQEDLGRKYQNKTYCRVLEIKNGDESEYFAPREVEARTFENKHILSAIEYYDSCCKK